MHNFEHDSKSIPTLFQAKWSQHPVGSKPYTIWNKMTPKPYRIWNKMTPKPYRNWNKMTPTPYRNWNKMIPKPYRIINKWSQKLHHYSTNQFSPVSRNQTVKACFVPIRLDAMEILVILLSSSLTAFLSVSLHQQWKNYSGDHQACSKYRITLSRRPILRTSMVGTLSLGNCSEKSVDNLEF